MSAMGEDRRAGQTLTQTTAGDAFAQWFETARGQYVLRWEQAQVDNAVDDAFGFHAVQVGLNSVDFLRENRIPHKVQAGSVSYGRTGATTLHCDPEHLPLASNSFDLVVLPHILEFSEHPHQILREAERVLIPEGQIVICGFNPLSLWGLRRRLGSKQQFPWKRRFISLLRLKDWLALLGFELNGGRFGCYAPPFAQARWLERFSFLEKAGDRWWPIMGGVYVVRGVKRVAGMRLVTPTWREAKVKRPSLVQVARRDNVIHVRPVRRQLGPEGHR